MTNLEKLTSENYYSTLINLQNGSIDAITADLTGLSKPDTRAALKLCKEKLSKSGTITVANIKKNTLILAGFQNIEKKEDGSFVGYMPKEIVAVELDLNQNQTKTESPVNPESLLTKEDKEKPDTKYDCGVDLGKKRQACKGCTCGLAEELEDDAKNKIKENLDKGANKPSCGSCYLGDAFRCASCPYAGQPAFDKSAPPKLAGKEDFGEADI